MATYDNDDLTPEQFDAAFDGGTPVEVVGHPKAVVQDLRMMPGSATSSRPDLTYGTAVVVGIEVGRSYEPVLQGARKGAAATA